jgi:ATP-dependent DNA helicase RecG
MTAREIFEQLNNLDEHHSIEAKRGAEAGKSIMETVCAFSNEPGLGGGQLLLGVEKVEGALLPTYDVVGIQQPERLAEELATQCATLFNVPVRPRITTESLQGKAVIVVDVPEAAAADKPVYFRSQGLPRGALRRIGSTDQHCGEDDLLVFYAQRTGESADEAVIKGSTVDELDADAIEHYRRVRAKVNPSAEELNWTDNELLEALSAVRRDGAIWRPTVTGLLLFGSRQAQRKYFPMMRVDYIRVPGNSWVSDPENRFTTVDMRGPLLSLVQRAQASVLDDLPKGFVLPEGQAQAETPQFSSRVLREAIVNAVMHRSYQVQGPIQIIRYNNRIEIINPGYSLKAEERLGEPGSETRNPHIAAIFHETNYAETKGSGIRTMRRLMDQAGFAPPTFESDRAGNRFITRLLLHHFLNPADLRWLAQFESHGLTDGQRRGLIFLREAGALDNATYRQLNGSDTLAASQDLRRLRELGLIEKRGQGSATYYVPTPVVQSPDQEGPTTPLPPTGAQIEKLHQVTGAQMPEPHQLPPHLKKRLPRKNHNLRQDEARTLIADLCAWRPMQLRELVKFLGRTDKYILRTYIGPMIQAGELEYTYPDMINHPRQAYRRAQLKQKGDR